MNYRGVVEPRTTRTGLGLHHTCQYWNPLMVWRELVNVRSYGYYILIKP